MRDEIHKGPAKPELKTRPQDTQLLLFLCKTFHMRLFFVLFIQINHRKDEVPLSRFDNEDMRANEEAAALAKKFEKKYVSVVFLLQSSDISEDAG